jgi:hypothetical protein
MGEAESARGWNEHGRRQILSRLRSTPAQRLGWLEQAIQLAAYTGALPRSDRGSGHRLERRGTVFIAWVDGHYTGYWGALPDGSPTLLEQMPDVMSAFETVVWGRTRAHRVLIRPRSEPSTYYWAGGHPPLEGTEQVPRFKPKAGD